MIHLLQQMLEHASAACIRSLMAHRCWGSFIVSPARVITILAVSLLQACNGSSPHEIWSDRSDTYLIPTFAQISPLSKASLYSLAISSNTNDLVAVGENGAIMRSEDGGKSWSVVPNSGTNNSLRHVTSKPKQDALVATGDGGAIGRSPVISEPKQGTLVAVGQRGAIVRSEDDGKNWLAVPNSGTTEDLQYVIFEPKQGALVAVGQFGAIVRSEDDGKSWLAVPNRDMTEYLRHVISEPKKGALIAVGGNLTLRFFGTGLGTGIVRSEDGGKSWFTVFKNTSNGLFHVVAEPKKGTLVAVGKKGVIVRSIDGGVSWSVVPNSGTENDLRHVIFEPKKSALVAVGKRGAIVRSEDDGKNWLVVLNSGTTADLRHVSFEPKGGALVAVGDGGAIVRSIDGGVNWSTVVNKGTKSLLSYMIVEPKGALVAVGDDGAIVRSAAPDPAPIVRRITHTYTANGTSVLSISLYDPANICPNAQCLKAYGRSEDDHTNRLNVKPRPLKISASSTGAPGEYELTINTEQLKLLSAKRPDPIYVQFQLEVPGYRRVYQEKIGTDFKIPNNPYPIVEEKWFQELVAGLIVLSLLFATHWAKPLWLLNVVSRPALLDAASKAGIPGLGDLVIALARSIALPVLTRHSRVLNAWVMQNTKALSNAFDVAAQGVSDRAPYSPLPLSGPDDELLTPSPSSLSSFFKSQRAFVEIIGQGGAGKTRLALEICRWLFAGKLTDHPSAAVFVDEEFTDLFSVIQAKINAALKQEAPPVEFLRALLSKGRLWVVVDRVSERQKSTRDAIAKVYRSISPRVILCTARFPITIDGETTLMLKPLPLDSDTLLGFVGEQLRAAGAAKFFPHLGDQGALIQGLAKQITIGTEELPITPLLVKILVSQAIELVRTHGPDALEKLPSSVPEAYFTYVERLDATNEPPKSPGFSASELIRRAASIVAFLELGDDFRPKPVSAAIVQQVLMAEPMLPETESGFLQRLEENGLIVRRIVGTVSSVEFILDPLAECLAAFEHARRCGSDQAQWSDLIHRVSARGEPAQGFMLALRMNHAAYADVLDFPHVNFPATL